MNNINTFFPILLYFLAAIGLIIVVNLDNRNDKKEKFLKNLPNKKSSLINRITERQDIHAFLTDLVTSNGLKNDSIDDLIKDITKGGTAGLLLFIVSIFFGAKVALLGFALFAFLAFFPIIKRKTEKKSFRKKYISDFYVFLNYITLYLSGGVEMKTGLTEVEKLIPKKSLIYQRVEDMINRNAISGFSGNTYIATLEEFNNGLNYPEIDTFINSAKRSQARGDAITDTLLIQINDISKKAEMDKRSYIISQESTFGAFKVLLCFTPLMLSIIVPIFISALSLMQL